MGIRKIKKVNKENSFDKLLDFIQLSFGLLFSLYGMLKNNNFAIIVGGLLLLFCRRRIDISIPLKRK